MNSKITEPDVVVEADWLELDIVRRTVDALGCDAVRFVGGAVRDTFIRRPVLDIDAATIHTPQETMLLLEKAGIKAVPTGLQHGTVTAVYDKRTIEITTLRVDVETDGRHAEVAFTKDWLADAKRRDFTFNAMYVSADGHLYDPFDGRADLAKGLVRFIGEAQERIREDALRILRYFRFFAHFGTGTADKNAVEACSKLRHLLADLSSERIRNELLKLLEAAEPMRALILMEQAGIFPALGCDTVACDQVEHLVCNEKSEGQPPNALLRLFILCKPSLNAAALAAWLKVSGKEKASLQAVEAALSDEVPQKAKGQRRFIYQHGNAAARAAALVTEQEAGVSLLRKCETWSVPVFPVQGRDLIAAGIKPGPALGEALQKLETLWIESDFTLEKKALLDRLGAV